MRDVTHDDDGPLFLDGDDLHPEKGDVAICRCGLSESFPFCDGSHRRVEDEVADAEASADGPLYRYVDGERKTVTAVEFADGSRLPASALVSEAVASDAGDENPDEQQDSESDDGDDE
ncbi:MAG: CDGSH iron-sulfur domain-containing protein [Halolamina sp.]